MSKSASPPARRRAGWFANRPIAVKILATIAFSASIGVVLCVVAVGRIDALAASQRDMYQGHVVAFSDLDAKQMDAYESITENPDLFAAVRASATEYLDTSDKQLVVALDAGDLRTASAVAAGPLVEQQK